MAINKKLIHFKTFANFNSLKLSANEANTKYTTGISGTETTGNPDILYQSICFIKDTQQIWTHGLIYNASADGSGIIIKFNQVFEDGESVTSNETNLFDKVLEAKNANVPVFFHDTNSPILISSYPMSIGNLIVASGARGAATYNFVIVSGSNSVSISTVDYVTSLDDVVTSDLIPTKTSDLTNDSGFITADDNVATATKLQNNKAINGIPFDGSLDRVNYAICSSAGDSSSKFCTVITGGFVLMLGAQVRVMFQNANTYTGRIKLNVNSTGDYAIAYKNNLLAASNINLEAGRIYTFTFYMSEWVLEGDWDSVNKQDTLVSGTNIKTINGTSILSSGDISITDEVELITISGDMLADEPTYTTTEAQSIIDAYNANKLIAVKCGGTRLTFGKGWFIPNINIRTQSGISQIFLSGILGNYYIEHRIVFDTSAGTVSATTQSLIDLSESGGSSGGSSNANVQAVDTGDVLDDVNVDYATKTYVDGLVGDINSTLESMVSGEVYLTPFTVEQFASGYVELTEEQRNELLDAASNNKIIGMPYKNTTAGYVLVEYKYINDTEYDYWSLTLNVVYSNVLYYNYIQSNMNLNFTGSRLTTIPLLQVSYTVSVEDGIAEVIDAPGLPDNSIYMVNGECTELNIYLEPSEIGKTVRFFTGENCSLIFSYDVYWANGELPTIEPYTHYELSLVRNAVFGFNAVLTPFKLVGS